MRNDTLQGALEALYGAERRHDKFGLDGTRALLSALGNPERRFRAVHVAGTNGKGSTCALIERVLRGTGLTTGLFTSPHLADFRERIRVNGRWVDEAWLAAGLRRIEALPGARDRTFFEVATALGFLDFAERGVEWAVIEVGLGGRLDSTNVIAPELCVITSIGLDHVELLGGTLEAIAAEKAGIIKPGVPVVVSPFIDPRALAVIERMACECSAPLIVAPESPVWAPPPGTMNERNVALAAAALATLSAAGVRIPPAALDAGLRDARWPGRCEACPTEPRLWWDGAHNPDGIDSLAGRGPFGAVVLALSNDKDADEMLRRLWAIVRPAALIATRTRSERGRSPEDLAARARAIGWEAGVVGDVAGAVDAALERTRSRQERVLLTGSLFAVGEAMEVFGGAPGERL